MWSSFRQNKENCPRPIRFPRKLDPTSAFKTHLGGIIWGTAVIDSKGNVYVGSTNKRFYCIDSMGYVKWVYKLQIKTDSLIDSAAALHPFGYVIIPGGDGCIHAVHMSTGKAVWKREMTDVSRETENSGVIVNSFEGNVQVDEQGLIYCGCDNQHMYCLAPNGNIVWKYKTGMMIWTCPIITNELCIFGSLDFHIYGVDKHTGTLVFKRNLGAEIKSTPLLYNGFVHVGTTNGQVFCLGRNGVIKWTQDIGTNIYSSPVIYKNNIIYACFDGRITCLDTSSGDPVWECQTYTDLCCSPIIVNDVLFIGNNIGKLIAIDCQNGTPLGALTCTSRLIEKQNINASIAFDPSGYLVFGAYDGNIYHVPWNFYEYYNDTSPANISNITKNHPYIRMNNHHGHIITLELVVPGKQNASIVYNTVKISPSIPFDTKVSADGKFINLIPKSWDYLGKKYDIHISGRYYLQTDHWMKDRFTSEEGSFTDHVSFSTHTPKNSTCNLSEVDLADFYIHQPTVMDTYIPAATDAQGFKMLLQPKGDSYDCILIPCVPDHEEPFKPIEDAEIITLQATKMHDVYRATGTFSFSAMGGTITSKTFVTFFHVDENRQVEGQLFSESSCFSIKGNGSSYKFSSEIVNKVCDLFMNLHIVGEFKGYIRRGCL
jgi:outer membrane protein assembly factor BamB